MVVTGKSLGLLAPTEPRSLLNERPKGTRPRLFPDVSTEALPETTVGLDGKQFEYCVWSHWTDKGTGGGSGFDFCLTSFYVI